MGPTGRGRLEEAVALPTDTPGLRATTSATRKGALYGHDTLVAALTRAATSLRKQYPDSVLYVGDIALAHGGAFPPHASHTNGRDVDLAFFVETPDGEDVDNGAMIRVLADGAVVGTGRHFDRARNWALVERLLQDPGIQVQWIFVAAEVRALLLAYAESVAADPTLLERARRVMLQPRDSSPHNDHFHVRVYCAREDRLRGCIDAPPFHPWVDDHGDALRAWLAGVAPFLELPGTDEYRWALDEIARNHVREALPLIETLPEPADQTDAALRADVMSHLRNRHGATTRWQDLAPIDSPP